MSSATMRIAVVLLFLFTAACLLSGTTTSSETEPMAETEQADRFREKERVQQITSKLENPPISTLSENMTPENEETDQVKEPEAAAPETEPCPITEEDAVALAKVIYQESEIVFWNGTRYGVSYLARKAAVGWCALNRLDANAYPDTLTGVLTYPNAFAYDENAPVTKENLWLAEDVISRWWREKQGETDVGRTLPPDYYFFHGDGRENHFRREYISNGEYWDWSLPDPYATNE